MIKKKNMIWFIIFIIVSAIIYLPISRYTSQEILSDNDFHYNVISSASIIGGFLFTGLGVLISTLDKERIKRIWENNYLDNLYRFSILGIMCNAVSIIIALFMVIFNCSKINENIIVKIVALEITTLISGLLAFLISIRYLYSIIKKLKSQN